MEETFLEYLPKETIQRAESDLRESKSLIKHGGIGCMDPRQVAIGLELHQSIVNILKNARSQIENEIAKAEASENTGEYYVSVKCN